MLKQPKLRLVGTSAGGVFHDIREKLAMMVAVQRNIAEVGTLANDQLATQLVTRICAPGMTFIDIGAHFGSIVAAVRRHCPSVKIVAFEAIPDKVEDLRRNFPQAEIHSCALSDQQGNVSFFVNRCQSGYSSLIRSMAERGNKISEITVKSEMLDKIAGALPVDTIKIDVEGAELRVLRGATGILQLRRPLIMFESGAPAEGEFDREKSPLWQFFADRNYELIAPNRLAHLGPGLSKDGFIEQHYYPRSTTNYFAVPVERRSEFRDRARRILGVMA